MSPATDRPSPDQVERNRRAGWPANIVLRLERNGDLTVLHDGPGTVFFQFTDVAHDQGAGQAVGPMMTTTLGRIEPDAGKPAPKGGRRRGGS